MLIPHMIEDIFRIFPRSRPHSAAKPTAPPVINPSCKLLITTMLYPRFPTNLESISRDDDVRGKHHCQSLDGVRVATRRGACVLDLLNSEHRHLVPVVLLVLTRQGGRSRACGGQLRSLIGVCRRGTDTGGCCLGWRRRRGVLMLNGQCSQPKVKYADPAGWIHIRGADAQRVE